MYALTASALQEGICMLHFQCPVLDSKKHHCFRLRGKRAGLFWSASIPTVGTPRDQYSRASAFSFHKFGLLIGVMRSLSLAILNRG